MAYASWVSPNKTSGITHSVLVSGGNGTDPQAAIVDTEIINFLDQH